MQIPEDISAKIRQDFTAADAGVVEQRLSALWRDEPGLFGERILRCIVWASQGRLSGLEHYITMARTDYRDLIVTAEYDRDWEQIRDLNRPFENVD
jgi:hypothetical protein